ncbi:hypothetical protein [uncultured Halomonas sp.]|uniref:hypothetical protein n=1 Tax=uncultured Halomonas sp. TaxID=173971 RepID=UPI0026186BCB|nr:hypothetical protein [uncultured Halomonas sp.]
MDEEYDEEYVSALKALIRDTNDKIGRCTTEVEKESLTEYRDYLFRSLLSETRSHSPRRGGGGPVSGG